MIKTRSDYVRAIFVKDTIQYKGTHDFHIRLELFLGSMSSFLRPSHCEVRLVVALLPSATLTE